MVASSTSPGQDDLIEEKGTAVYSATVTAELQASTDSPDGVQESPKQQEESSLMAEASVSGIFKVVMMKGATGVGFCLEGGKGSPKGDVPIIIKRIFKGLAHFFFLDIVRAQSL